MDPQQAYNDFVSLTAGHIIPNARSTENRSRKIIPPPSWEQLSAEFKENAVPWISALLAQQHKIRTLLDLIRRHEEFAPSELLKPDHSIGGDAEAMCQPKFSNRVQFQKDLVDETDCEIEVINALVTLQKYKGLQGQWGTCGIDYVLEKGLTASYDHDERRDVLRDLLHRLPQYELAEKARDNRRQNRGQLGAGWFQAENCGCSKARLWVKQDHDGYINDRVIIKSSPITRDKTLLAEKLRGPVEVHIMERLAGHNVVVGLRNWRQISSLAQIVTYQEFCPHGSLADLFSLYSDDDECVPEPFCWYIVMALAVFGCLAEKGTMDGPKIRGWGPIYHRALTFDNIFLGLPLDIWVFKGYPTPKVGGFGMAISWKAKRGYSFTKDEYLVAKTHPQEWMAPEQIPSHERGNDVPYIRDRYPDAKIDVYQMGYTLYKLVFQVDRPPQTSGDIPYSETLQRLIEHCMAPHPKDRPTFEEVLALAIRSTSGENNEPDLSRGLFHAPARDPAWQAEGKRLRKPVDKWMIGFLAMFTDEFVQPPKPPFYPLPRHGADDFGGGPAGLDIRDPAMFTVDLDDGNSEDEGQ